MFERRSMMFRKEDRAWQNRHGKDDGWSTIVKSAAQRLPLLLSRRIRDALLDEVLAGQDPAKFFAKGA